MRCLTGAFIGTVYCVLCVVFHALAYGVFKVIIAVIISAVITKPYEPVSHLVNTFLLLACSSLCAGSAYAISGLSGGLSVEPISFSYNKVFVSLVISCGGFVLIYRGVNRIFRFDLDFYFMEIKSGDRTLKLKLLSDSGNLLHISTGESVCMINEHIFKLVAEKEAAEVLKNKEWEKEKMDNMRTKERVEYINVQTALDSALIPALLIDNVRIEGAAQQALWVCPMKNCENGWDGIISPRAIKGRRK